MLTGEALRIAAIEVLNPTQANIDGHGFPTIANGRVYDSRAARVNDLDEKPDYQPVLSIYTRQTGLDLRGAASSYDDMDPSVQLEIIGELATIVKDEGETYADAVAGNDPEARMVLAGLMARVRYLLCYSEAGALFRSIASPATKIENETHAVPEFGLRWQRIFMRMTFPVLDDTFVDDAGAPEPIKSLMEKLPALSAGRAKLDALNAAFTGQERTPLEKVYSMETPDGLAALAGDDGDQMTDEDGNTLLIGAYRNQLINSSE